MFGIRPTGLYWNYVPYRNIFEHDLHPYFQRDTKLRDDWAHRTVIIDNFSGIGDRHYNQGPRASDVEQHAGQKPVPLPFVDRQQAGRSQGGTRDQLQVYRPEVQHQQPDQSTRPQQFHKPYQATPRGVEASPQHRQPVADGQARANHVYPTKSADSQGGSKMTPQRNNKGQNPPDQQRSAPTHSKTKGRNGG